MSDLIDRQMLKADLLCGDNAEHDYCFPCRAILEHIDNLPSAQPSSSYAHENDQDLQPTCNNLATDCISRQAAIDAMKDVLLDEELDYAIPTLERLPSAQPDLSSYSDKLWRNAYERGRKDAVEEIIHCRDCENWDKTWTNDFSPNYHYCPMVDVVRKDNFYCADAERRKDG